jgi:translation initiation factor 2 alpha subunit (eIF-2alpha)
MRVANFVAKYSTTNRSKAVVPYDKIKATEKWVEYAHVHKQNIDYCPATFKMVEKLVERFGDLKK